MDCNIIKYKLADTYRTIRIKDKNLIITNSGSFIALNDEDYKKFRLNKLNQELYDTLEENRIIITEKNESKVIDYYKKKNNFLNFKTSLHIVVLTLRCNQVCTYCQALRRNESEKQYDMTEEIAKKTVDLIFQSPSKHIIIEFQGGEPLLNFSTLKFIVEYANTLNKIHRKILRFSIVSNYTLLNNEILDYLIKNRVGLCTSLDGPKEVHDKNRIYSGKKGSSYDDVIKGINLVRSKKLVDKDYEIDQNALPTITKHSLNYPKQIVDEYVKHQFKRVWIRYLSGLEFGANKEVSNKIGYTAEEYLDFYKKALEYIIENDLPIQERFAAIILKKIMTDEDPNYLDLRSPCGAVIGQMAYNYDGSVYSCDEGRMIGDIFKVGTVDNNYNDIICSEETCNLVASSINDTYLCDNCAFKPYCGICPVINYATTGNLIPKLAVDMRCKIYKGLFTFLFEKLLYDEKYRQKFELWIKDPIR